jgi:antitoxin component YwqK of YwqJK toxin-antitoxin module
MKLLLLFVFSTFFCFSQKTIRTYYDYRNTQPDEVYTVNARGQKSGLYTKFDSYGAKAVEATYVNGLLNGPSKEYYRNNGSEKIKISGTFLNDQKHGLFTTYTYVKYDQSYYEIMNNMYFNGSIAKVGD